MTLIASDGMRSSIIEWKHFAFHQEVSPAVKSPLLVEGWPGVAGVIATTKRSRKKSANLSERRRQRSIYRQDADFAWMSGAKPSVSYRTRDEFRLAVAALTDTESAQLDDAANVLALRAAGWKGEDLLQEAAERTLAGRRRWPAHVEIVPYLVKAMQSIISAERKKALVRRANVEGRIDPDYSGVTDPTQTQDDVEARLRAEITEAFKRHPNALKVALGTLDGLAGEQLREFTGLDATSYASARKQMRREIERFVRSRS